MTDGDANADLYEEDPLGRKRRAMQDEIVRHNAEVVRSTRRKISSTVCTGEILTALHADRKAEDDGL